MVTSPLVEFHSFGWGGVLVFSVTGFLSGIAISWRGRTGIGAGVGINTIDAARCPEAFRRTGIQLPLLPRIVFGASAFPVFAIPWYWRTPFFTAHPLYLLCLTGLALSAGALLARLSDSLDTVDRKRAEHIREFLSDSEAPVPKVQAQFLLEPRWFRIWNALNFVAFLLLTLTAVQGLLKEISPLK